MREVKAKEIAFAAQRWAVGDCHIGRVAGPTSERTFTYVAEKWLRFNGQLITPVAPVGPTEQAVSEFAHAMKHVRGLSAPTIRGYSSRSALFLQWLTENRGMTLAGVSLFDIDAYLDTKRAIGWTASSVATQCQAMRTFFRYAEGRRWCPAGIAKGIKSPTLPKYDTVRQGPTWRDVKRLLKPASDKAEELRASAVISLCAIYGLRSSELTGLLLSDFDWVNETFTVRHAKRGRIQQYPIQYEVGEALIRYLRYGRPHSSCRNVFLTRLPPFRPAASSGMWQIVSKRIRRLGIVSEHIGPHALRHSCATQLLKRGSSLKDIADLLGHKDLKSVGVYAKYDVRSLRHVAAFSLAGLR